MRFGLFVLMGVLLCGQATFAATGKVLKVLPHFVDAEGRVALSPSLFERDAYQAYLRKHKDKRFGLKFSVNWKTKEKVWEPLKIQVQLRGTAEGNLPKEYVMEAPAEKHGIFGNWTDLNLTGQAYQDFGEVTAWRVTLWEGDDLLSEQRSFLW